MMFQQAPDLQRLKETANKIVNGDWQRMPYGREGGLLDFVLLERRIFEALVFAACPTSQASLQNHPKSEEQQPHP